ncbi:MAG: hypothetical protein IJK32_02800 [Bacteroidales bacterium]|nr:hypothetical protein [Bacteroidales bacterium]
MEKVKAYQVTITHRSDETIHLALYDYIDHQTNVAYYYIASKEFDDTNNNILNVRGKVSHATAAKLCSFCLIKDGIPCITGKHTRKYVVTK